VVSPREKLALRRRNAGNHDSPLSGMPRPKCMPRVPSAVCENFGSSAALSAVSSAESLTPHHPEPCSPDSLVSPGLHVRDQAACELALLSGEQVQLLPLDTIFEKPRPSCAAFAPLLTEPVMQDTTRTTAMSLEWGSPVGPRVLRLRHGVSMQTAGANHRKGRARG